MLGVLVSCFALTLHADAQTQTDEKQKPLVLKPDLPTTMSNHRLILKDGSFQICRRYEIDGERVRYISVERAGDWEELPAELVDWVATRKWERDHADMAEEPSPGMKEAAEVDKEEAAARAEAMARTPEVVKGLELPDQDGVFALDTFHGTPELVEIQPHEADVNVKGKHGLQVVNPLAGASAHIELDGMHAKIHLHVNDPVFYLSLDSRDDAENVIRHAITVDTGKAKEAGDSKHGAHSMNSGFYIVRVDERKTVRIVGVLHQSATGKLTQQADAIRAQAEPMTGKRWLKLTPAEPLTIGEYALVEMLPTNEMSATIWDFRVDPRMEENPEAFGPVQK
jgi:hypothetical protein